MTIYKITNLINGKIYIGQTIKTLQRRFAVHKSCKRNSILTSAFKCYGKENFCIEPVISCLDVAALDDLEIKAIEQFNSLKPNGYNQLKGGNVSQQRGRTPWNKGKKASKKAIANQSKSHLGQVAWNKTVIYCVETGEKFESLKDAATKLNLQSARICDVLKGNRRHTKKLTFKYLGG